MTNQTLDNRVACRRVDGKVKRFLRGQKHRSFMEFCEFLDPSVGIGRVRRRIRSLSSRSSVTRTDRTTDPSSPVFQSLREELICSHVSPVDIPLITELDESDPMNGPSFDRELFAALGACNMRSAPSLDGINYETLLGLLDHSSSSRVIFLLLFNVMFREKHWFLLSRSLTLLVFGLSRSLLRCVRPLKGSSTNDLSF